MSCSPFVRTLLVLALVTAGALADRPLTAAAAQPVVDIVVKNWTFTPAEVDAHVGQPTLLRFTDSEGVHGVESADIGLDKTMITPGKITEVTFTPKTAGTYAVHCAVICGEGHDKMALTVHVVP